MTNPPLPQPANHLREGVPPVLAAAWGTCLGLIFAAIVTSLARAGIIAIPAIGGSQFPVKPLEELFYLTFYVAATLLAFAFANRARIFRSAVTTAVGVAVVLATAAWVALTAIYGGPFAFVPALPPLEPQKWSTFATQVIPLSYWLVLPLFALAAPFVLGRPRRGSAFTYRDTMPWVSGRLSRPDVLWLLAAGAFFAACLFPLDLESVATRIGYDKHVVSFYIGPALFLWHRGLIPGIDFFPQYGIGIGAFFSLFLQPGAEATIANTALVTAGLSLIYFTSAQLVLSKLYRSRIAAFAVVLFGLLLNFHLDSAFEDPSAWPCRYPFLFLTVWLFSLAVESKRQPLKLAVAGSAAGLCLFWNTETGLYAMATVLVATVLLNRDIKAAIMNVGATAGGIIFAFLLLSVITYGPGVFQLAFFVGLIKPMTIYAEGLGAFPIIWQSPFNFLCAIVSPLIGFSTMGWSAAALIQNESTYRKQTLVVLFMLSLLGNCLMLKWVNMSYDALWYVNAMPILAVSAWWIKTGLQYVEQRLPIGRLPIGMASMKGAILLIALLFLLLVRDNRNPSKYALQSFVLYPSLLIGAFETTPKLKWTKGHVTSKDLQMLLRCSGPDERVAIISDYDWTLLLAAHRTPQMPWLPSTTMYAFPFLVKDAFRYSGPLFIDKTIVRDELGTLGALGDALRERLKSYRPGVAGNALQLYDPKDVPMGGRTPESC